MVTAGVSYNGFFFIGEDDLEGYSFRYESIILSFENAFLSKKFRFIEVFGREYFITKYFFIVFYSSMFYYYFSGYEPWEF